MKTTIHLFFIILFVAVQIVNAQDKTEAIDHTQEHIEFLKEFYMEYISEQFLSKSHKGGKEIYQNYLSILEKYCTQSLAEKVLQANKTFELGYNPFIYAQDISTVLLETLQVKKYGKQENLYEVSFNSFNYFKQDNSDITKIKFEVINNDKGCKINAVGVLKGD